uniref:39S ribosomal protein L50, mitochondrial n=1 Tax=Angiostrongylus cantonensis TaxID=6313 RepID=A0A0K0D7N1_ANGCA
MLAALFRERPMWTRNAIAYKTNLEDTLLKQHTKIPERQRLKVSSDRSLSLDNNMPVHFTYQPGRLPRVRQMWYSLCDIKLPLADALLRRDHTQASEPEVYGWIPAELLEELREKVKEDVRKTTEDMDADEDMETDDF